MTSVAIVHEWFTKLAGSESVVEQLCQLYPEADLFAVYADPEVVSTTPYLKNRRLQTSFIQRMPFAAKRYRSYLPLMPIAIEQLDVTGYDLVLSSSHAVAKGVLTGPAQLHISYVHSPIRYAWDLQHQYLEGSGLDRGLKSVLARSILHYIRMWDYRTSAGVDHFVANSRFIARRIDKVYRRSADVIHPPVDVSGFEFREDKEPFYLTASRMVPYKRMDIIVAAFRRMPNRRLVVIGDGPEYDRVRDEAGPNVEFLGHAPFSVLVDHLQRARAFVFAALEDFGILPVEAQACGTPVIAYGRGGALESVRGEEQGEATGLFFKEQTPEAIVDAVERFEDKDSSFSPHACRRQAERFSQERFRLEMSSYIRDRFEGGAPTPL